MATEHALWRYVNAGMRERLGPRWSAQRHEDRYASGIPDVSYGLNGVDGWIELKAVDRWPTGVPLTVGLTAEQAAWLKLRGRAGGGRCFVLVRVGRFDHLVFHWRVARRLVEPVPAHEVSGLALRWWRHSVDFDELEQILIWEGGP